MYRTQSSLTRTVRVVYPPGRGPILLRTELNWDRQLQPDQVLDDGRVSVFHIEARRPFVYFKPCLGTGSKQRWSAGPNRLLLMTTPCALEVYPFFEPESEKGSLTDIIEIPSAILGRKHMLRVYLPPGYEENTLKRFPVLYMQDGKNLFFPEEAFQGREWQVDESLNTLDTMNAADKVIVAGIWSGDRMKEYTKPGYAKYARAIVEEVKPVLDQRYRTLPERTETSVMGSSLGGVVSFYMAWQYPEVFGHAACLSSTFSHRDDLIDRVLAEPKRDVKFYLDSGWPEDNYEVTQAMAMALQQRGYVHGRDFVHFAFPHAEHDENAWGGRVHLPIQLFNGKISAAERSLCILDPLPPPVPAP